LTGEVQALQKQWMGAPLIFQIIEPRAEYTLPFVLAAYRHAPQSCTLNEVV
jgi:hypothetical protein